MNDGVNDNTFTEITSINTVIANNPTVNSAIVSTFPLNSEGFYFRFYIITKNSGNLESESNIIGCYLSTVPNSPSSTPRINYNFDNPKEFKLEFDYLNSNEIGYSNIIAYEVQVDDGTGKELVSLNLTLVNHIYIIENSIFALSKTIRSRYRAINSIGPGEWSDISYLLLARKPIKPLPPIFITASETTISVKLSFSTIDNGSPIEQCSISLNDGILNSNNFTEISTFDAFSYVINITNTLNGILPQKYYSIKYKCKNSVAWSDFSTPLLVYTSSKPIQPSKPIRNINSNYVNSINLQWEYIDNLLYEYVIVMTDSNNNHIKTFDTIMNKGWMLIRDSLYNIMNITNLTIGKIYKFYISSILFTNNTFIVSEESEPLIAIECYKPIYLPVFINKRIQIKTISKRLIRISIDLPTFNGGCEVTEYEISYMIKNDEKQVTFSKQDRITSNEFSVNIKKDRHLISIRVNAINQAGVSNTISIEDYSLK